jgi:hypothetical protein
VASLAVEGGKASCVSGTRAGDRSGRGLRGNRSGWGKTGAHRSTVVDSFDVEGGAAN